ncbi:MAG TPA: alpha/beta fold hydrolase [Thermoleophilaceae bacterium]|nr:alpha/beta fold hydrolase [Thermoleophilaceae bacterium]
MDEMPPVAGVQHRFVDVNGLRVHVAEAGRGEPVVMLHGWPQHWYLWRDVIPRLAPHARVICPDLRGFGWTDAPRSGYDRETMRRDLEALIDRLDLDRIRLVGHDWGGWIGFLLCLDRPERVVRFVAAGILPPWPSHDPRSVLELWRAAYQIPLALPYVGRRVVEHGAARLLLRSGSTAFSNAELDAFAGRLTGERARASELLYRSFLTREGPAAAAGRYDRPLEVPTLLVAGGRDLAVPVRTLREHAARAALLELELLPEVGHFIVDERPELMAERVLRMF